jgi:preprotein translocase subunit SecF
LSIEKGIQNSNTKTSNNFNSSVSNIDLIKNSKKINFVKMIMCEKKKIVSFILFTVVLKIIVHFFVFPTEILVLNTNKKIQIQLTSSIDNDDWNNEIREIRQKNYKALEKRYKIKGQIIITGDEVYYYPNEKEKVSVAKHIEETFTQKLWLFPWVICLLLFLFWINNKSVKDKLNDTNKKHNFSSYFSKQYIIVILLLSVSIVSNIYLFTTNESSNNIEKTSGYANDAQSYMNKAEEYMNSAEEYMNNAAQSAQEAEEFANSI